MSEFYVGYGAEMPPGIRRRILAVVVFLLVMAAIGAVLLARPQTAFAPSVFEYGRVRTFEGSIAARPYPVLIVKRPGTSETGGAYSHYLLVGAGKHGADAEVAGFDGKNVQLRGALVYRGSQTMIQLEKDSILETGETGGLSEISADMGTRELTGEIVDSKCYLGVMNPGQGKVHRDCAVRCISGGVPAALATTDLDGTPSLLLLTDDQNDPLPKDVTLNLVGQPVRIRGHVVKIANLLYLQTDSANMSALP